MSNKIKTVHYTCVLCGGDTSYAVNALPLCEKCQGLLQMLQELGINRNFFVRNFLWFKGLSDFYSSEDNGKFEVIFRTGKVVKADLTLTLLYNE